MGVYFHSAIFGLRDLIFWLRVPYPPCDSGKLESNHLEEVGISPPTHLPPNGQLLLFSEIMIGFTMGIFLHFFVLHPRVPIFWIKVVYHHTNFVLKSQRPAKKLIIDLRPTYHPMGDFDFFPKSTMGTQLHSAIFGLRDPIFWLRVPCPLYLRRKNSR